MAPSWPRRARLRIGQRFPVQRLCGGRAPTPPARPPRPLLTPCPALSRLSVGATGLPSALRRRRRPRRDRVTRFCGCGARCQYLPLPDPVAIAQMVARGHSRGDGQPTTALAGPAPTAVVGVSGRPSPGSGPVPFREARCCEAAERGVPTLQRADHWGRVAETRVAATRSAACTHHCRCGPTCSAGSFPLRTRR